MKKHIITFFILFLASLNIVFGESEINSSTILTNTETTISANMLNKYVIKLKNQLINFKIKYHIKNDEKIESKINELNKLSTALKKVQDIKTDEKIAKNIVKSVISSLKNIDSTIKPYLQEIIKKENDLIIDFKTKHKDKLRDFGSRIKGNTSKIKSKIKSKSILTEKDKKILLYIGNISTYANNIKKTDKIDFDTLYDLKAYIINNIKSIVYELQKIKQIL